MVAVIHRQLGFWKGLFHSSKAKRMALHIQRPCSSFLNDHIHSTSMEDQIRPTEHGTMEQIVYPPISVTIH